MQIDFVTVDVFTDRRFSGNQLAVFLEAGALTGEQMLAIAREMNYSESTFVVGRGEQGPRVRIFTPEQELPFAGHPTLGTAAVVSGYDSGRVVLELGVGAVPVDVAKTNAGAHCELTAPEGRELPCNISARELCEAVAVRERDLDPTLPIAIWSCGNAFAFIAVKDADYVTASRAMASPTPGNWPLGIVVFALTGKSKVHARVFSPGSAVPEDPATGSANAPLIAYLHRHERIGIGEVLRTAQGIEMGRPSELKARLLKDADGILRPRVAGGVVPVIAGRMTL